MIKIHPKVYENLLKCYFYIGNFSFDYFIEMGEILNISKKPNLNEEFENYKSEFKKEHPNLPEKIIEEFTSKNFDINSYKGDAFNYLLTYLKSLEQEDIFKLLLNIFPDAKFKSMQWDSWNSFGQNVKDWRGDLIHFLKMCGVEYDLENKELVSVNDNLNMQNTIFNPNLLESKFDDIFYKKICLEINTCFKLGLYTSSCILSRKLIENLIIDILRLKFPQNDTNLPIYYRVGEGRFHDLTILIKQLEKKKYKFGIDIDHIEKFIELIKPFRPIANSNAHSIIILSEKSDIEKYQIEEMIGLLIRLKEKLI